VASATPPESRSSRFTRCRRRAQSGHKQCTSTAADKKAGGTSSLRTYGYFAPAYRALPSSHHAHASNSPLRFRRPRARSRRTRRVFPDHPNVTVVNTSAFDATFGNAGKGIFDPQVLGRWGVAYGAGFFVPVGGSLNDTAIRWLTSPDGTNWTPRSQAIPSGRTTSQTSRVHFLNGKFLFFFSTGGTSTTQACTSSDGLTWTYAKVADNRINAQEFDASPTLTVVAANNGNQ
jgi:hypothetical protein